MKRGCDHHWEIRRYRGDAALYAHCKCGFQYNCSSYEKDEKGYWKSKIKYIYLYCPYCGARKKWYNIEPIKIDKFAFEQFDFFLKIQYNNYTR